MAGSGTCGGENGSDADKIHSRLCSTNGGELAAYLILLMIAHAEAVEFGPVRSPDLGALGR